MNVERAGFWSRLAAWIWGTDRVSAFEVPAGSPQGASPASVDEDTLRRASPVQGPNEPPFDGGKSVGVRGPSTAFSADQRLVELVDAIRQHLSAQSERSELTTAALHRLADGLDRFPEASTVELRLLERIAADSTATTGTVKKLADSLSRLPDLADAEREALVTIRHELERDRQSDQALRESLDAASRGIAAVVDAMTGVRSGLDRLRSESNAAQERLLLIVERQTERLTWFTAGALGAAGLGVLLALIALYRLR